MADGRYDYLETGSLISIRENVEGIVIPSEEERVQMHPLTFPEFLRAAGEEPLLHYDSFTRTATFPRLIRLERSHHILGRWPFGL